MLTATHDLDSIKKKDLPQIIHSKGISIKPNGKGYTCRCPFHDDHTPSLHINRKDGVWVWHCFGCDEGGTIIDFIMKYDHITFNEAITSLSPQKEIRESHIISLNDVIHYYHKVLLDHDRRGMDYLVKRNIASSEISERFKIGFVDGSLAKKLGNNKENIQKLKDIGILNEKGLEPFFNCVVFPITNENDEIVGVYGRNVTKTGHLYLKGPHRGVFNWQAIKVYDEIIIVESIIDTLSLYKTGIRNVVPLYGTNGFTEDHISLIKKYNVKSIKLLLDGDEAGKKASERLKERIRHDLPAVSVTLARLPAGSDPNDYLKSHSSDELKALLNVKSETKENQINIRRENDDIFITFRQREYRIRGLSYERFDRMRVNIKVRQSNRYHLDSIDLYSHKMRQDYVKQSLKTLSADQAEMEQELVVILEELEKIQAERVLKGDIKRPPMTEDEKDEALNFLKDKNLIENILKDFKTCGYVGEEINFLMGYLCATSRKISKPLAVMSISRSGAGKSMLQDAILSFMPEEDCMKYTRITDQSLFYRGENDLKHKFIAIEEEKGVNGAAYAVRNLLSAQSLTTSTTERDPDTGKMITRDYTVSGPTSMMISTTSSEFDYETLNRFIIITINESKEQTQKILAKQRELETLSGMIQSKKQTKLLKKHQNAQRLLRSIEVVNNYGPYLTFNDERLISRRGQVQYLSIIRTIALLRQYQKDIKQINNNGTSFEYIEVDLKDIEMANTIANEVLGQSLDELPPPSRNLLNEIMKIKQAKQNKDEDDPDIVSRSEIRDRTGWGECQIRRHIQPLVNHGYLYPSIGSRGKRYIYEIIYNHEGEKRDKFMMGLIDIDKLRQEKTRSFGCAQDELLSE